MDKKVMLATALLLCVFAGSARTAGVLDGGLDDKNGGVDIWNLPELEIEQGRYTADWSSLSRQYNVPAWWREAKLGAWSHWDPQ